MAEYVYNGEQIVKVGDIVDIVLPIPCKICGEQPIMNYKSGYGWDLKCEGHNETNWYQTRDAAIQTWNEMMIDG